MAERRLVPAAAALRWPSTCCAGAFLRPAPPVGERHRGELQRQGCDEPVACEAHGTLAGARVLSGQWRKHCNTVRPQHAGPPAAGTRSRPVGNAATRKPSGSGRISRSSRHEAELSLCLDHPVRAGQRLPCRGSACRRQASGLQASTWWTIVVVTIFYLLPQQTRERRRHKDAQAPRRREPGRQGRSPEHGSGRAAKRPARPIQQVDRCLPV